MEYRLSERMDGLNGAATREILKLTANPEIISFAGGMPGKDCFPEREIAEITAELLGGPRRIQLLTYGTTDGLASAREVMAQYAAEFGIRGLSASNVLMVSGGQQGLDLACMATLDKGDVVLVENPTYLTMLQIIKSFEARAVGVAGTDDGLDIDDLEEKIRTLHPKMLYVVPTFGNPTGKTYSLGNRRRIAEVTAKYGVLVVEDDPYSRLRYEGEAVPSLGSVGGDNVVFVTSFSKIIAPGLRVGCCFGSPEILRKMEICKQGIDVHTPNLNQAIAEEFVRRDLIKPHLARVCPVYKAKKDAMFAAIKRYMPSSFRCEDTQGGLFLWGRFDSSVSVDTHAAFPAAIGRKVAYVYGDVFYADGRGFDALRLNYSNATAEQIERGVRAMGGLFAELTK